MIACENSRLSSLLATWDVSPEGTSAPQRHKLHTDDVNLSGICLGVLYIVLAIVYERQTKGKRSHGSTRWIYYNTVHFLGIYSSLAGHLSFAGARSPKKTKLYHNRPGET